MNKMSEFFFSSRRRHTRYWRDWSSDVCSSDLHLCLRPREYLRGFGRGTVLSRAGRLLVDEALGVLGRQLTAEPRVLGASSSCVERGSGAVAAAAGTAGFRLALRLAVVPLGEHFAGMVGTQFRHRVRRGGRDEVRHS